MEDKIRIGLEGLRGEDSIAEIIKLVKQSHLSARQTPDQIGVSRSTFYLWHDLYLTGNLNDLEGMEPHPAAYPGLDYRDGVGRERAEPKGTGCKVH